MFRAKSDRKRYEEQMAQYQPPDKQANRKRNKTGYNMFFSAHVLRLKQTESGVPSERGSVARLVGTAWKLLAPEEKAYYEREADKHNGMHPVKDGEEEDEDEEIKRQQMEYHMHAAAHSEMQMHGGLPPPMHAGMQHPQHDTRHHHGYYPPHMYGPPPPYGHYDYSQHHQRHQQARTQGYQQGYPPPPRHYEG
jgi:HMG (high mobility group) box